MSLLDATNYDEVQLGRPILDRQAVAVTLIEVKEEVSDRDSNRTDLVVVHALAQEAKDTNGNTVRPGFQFTERFGHLAENGAVLPEGQRTANRINSERQKMLICAGLGIPASTKGINKLLLDQGGWSALNGRTVIATVAARTDKKDASRVYQAVTGYSAPTTAATAPANPF